MNGNHVKCVIGRIGNGCTEPLIAILEDDTHVIIKTFNNVQGNLSLVNEYVCYNIAKELNLTIPDAGLCIVDEYTSDDNNLLEQEMYGVGFYSTRVDRTTVISSPKMISLAENVGEMMMMILFDHLIYNKDRNQGNLLLSFSKSKKLLHVIDHTHVFNLQCIWDKSQLQRCIDEKDFEDEDILVNNQYLYQMIYESISIQFEELIKLADNINEKLSKELFENVISKVPDEWCMNKDDLNKLVDYLVYRLDHIYDYCKLICNFKGR